MIRPERFAWVVVNVTDLERSRRFYEAFTPLRVRGSIAARPQRFAALGIERGSFAGYLLTDGCPGSPCAVVLVEWREPEPCGATYPSHTNPGYFRIGFQSERVSGLYERVVAAGYQPLSPLRLPTGEHRVGRPVFSFRDPDGAVVEFITLPGPDRLYHANCNTADVERAHEFYEGVLGLRCFLQAQTHTPELHSFGPGGDRMTYRARLYRAPDGDPDEAPVFALDVVESTFPGPVGHVYEAPTNVGIIRIGLQVDDVDAAHAALLGSPGAGRIAPPEIWDLGGDVGRIRVLLVRSPDGAPVELVERG